MIALKKDFVNENTESYCAKGKLLSSGKAYYLLDSYGNIHFAGKQCAEQYATNDLSQIPDLTKSLTARHEGTSTGGRTIGGTNKQNDFDKSKAITYLLFREEKLSDYTLNGKSMSYSKLQEYYQIYKNENDLSNDAIRHILNIEKYTVENINRRLSLKNLSTCYAYQYILERTLEHLRNNNNNEGIEFVNSLLNGDKGLKKYCGLTQEQIVGLSKWLQFLPQDLRETKLKNFSF